MKTGKLSSGKAVSSDRPSNGSSAVKTGSGWKSSLAAVLKTHNSVKQDGSVASYATQDKRADVLYAGFTELRQLGYRLDSVESLRGRHVETLVTSWQERQLSASTIQNNLSVFRTFSDWIGKAGMVQGVEHYLGAGAAGRSSIAKEDKSWAAKGIDIRAKIEEVRLKDERVALQLELQAAFGLRAREAMQLRPHVADKGTYLSITHGTKGGRDRVTPIDTAGKRALLERAKTFTATPSSSTSDQNRKLHQWKNHFYQVVRACGITRRDGITSHGLRHAYAKRCSAPAFDPAQHTLAIFQSADLGVGQPFLDSQRLGPRRPGARRPAAARSHRAPVALGCVH